MMKYLKDYKPSEYLIDFVNLKFELFEQRTLVHAHLRLSRNSKSTERTSHLLLNGEDLTLKAIEVNGTAAHRVSVELPSELGTYQVTEKGLVLGVKDVESFELKTSVEIYPHKNMSCEGLYLSSGMYCTQCEAESFRRMTYYLDRPDVMSVFTVRIEADQSKFPVLLSNGNRVETGVMPEGRHYAVWNDPHKKPAYLFALVAGDLGVLHETFLTRSGRKVDLEIYAQHGMQKRSEHAMHSLKLAMKWDEDRFGLEYDLDRFMIVVAHDFNMGAMENKGLNVFNAHYVLADTATAVDLDFQNILAVVGHEYFHNWTGNRVTCRDWFQLSLKEGLTVYRDQEFTADHGSPAVKRIEDIIRMRTFQFAEDSGPMAHPVRPQSYQSIDNFYTVTIYEKGAEVIRMITQFLGRDLFRKGMDVYFKNFDGQAVTTDDFVQSMVDACLTNETLSSKRPAAQEFVKRVQQFKRWYDFAGTPTVRAEWVFDSSSQVLKVKLKQILPKVKGASTEPYLIPVQFAAFAKEDGRQIVSDQTLVLSEMEQEFSWSGMTEAPVVSIARGLSAPIKVELETSTDELLVLAQHDTDHVNRWEAVQKLMMQAIVGRVKASDAPDAAVEAALVRALRSLLTNPELDAELVSLCLTLPAESYVAQSFQVVDVVAIHRARRALAQVLGRELNDVLWSQFESGRRTGSDLDHKSIGQRALTNSSLMLLAAAWAGPLQVHQDRQNQVYSALVDYYHSSPTMTQKMGALEALNIWPSEQRDVIMKQFAETWKADRLVMNKWLKLQARNPGPEPLRLVHSTVQSGHFDANNPNNIYNLILGFALGNTEGFHAEDGSGYVFIADQVLETDRRNPQVASRLVSAFNPYRTYDEKRKTAVRRELSRIAAGQISDNVREVVTRALEI